MFACDGTLLSECWHMPQTLLLMPSFGRVMLLTCG